jgi:hypothetical protein
MAMQTEKRRYRVDRTQICFLRFIFEAYDGIAVLTTLDPQSGLVELAIAPGCAADVEGVLADLGKAIMIEAWPEVHEPVCKVATPGLCTG